MTSKTNPVVIFDLDGTILSVNSFPLWVRYLLYGHFGGMNSIARVGLSLRVATVLVGRKLFARRHISCKRDFQRYWQQAVQADIYNTALDKLNASLLQEVRPNLRAVLATLATQGAERLLATAAAGEYAQDLGRKLGFEHVLHTPIAGTHRIKENVGECKRDRILQFLHERGWEGRPCVFFTDHVEDLPMIMESHLIFWLGTDEMLVQVRALAPEARLLQARTLPPSFIIDLVKNIKP